AVARHHLRDLLRGPLMQVEPHLRVAAAEFADDVRQYITRLGVSGADRQAPLALIAQLGRKAADRASLLQDSQCPVDLLLPGRGDTGEIAPFAHEYLETELVLQQLDLLTDARLRGMQLLRRGGDVQTALRHGREIT